MRNTCLLMLGSWMVWGASALGAADIPDGYPIFPANNIWNQPVDSAPVQPNSDQWMDQINGHTGHTLHADFGYMYAGHYNGIPYNVVGSTTPLVHVTFAAGAYISESDPLPSAGLPIPPGAIAEGDPAPVDLTGDRHLLLIDVDNHVLHEMYQATRQPDGSWTCTQYSRWDLTSNALRPDNWTSADAAGLPILPGLVRWDEVQSGQITHALRFTLSLTYKPHLWPARHDAVSGSALNPPMGMRVRLKANFDISGYSATNQVILKALKKYGMFLADNGGDWFISGAPDPHWSDDDLSLLAKIVPNSTTNPGTAVFEVVDTSAWIVNPNSGQASPVAVPPSIALKKSSSPTTAKSGDTVTFTITYQNTSSAPATSVVIYDVVPAGSSLVSGSVSSGGVVSGSTMTWTLGALPANASGQVSFQAQVK